jgi:hypothetical protein
MKVKVRKPVILCVMYHLQEVIMFCTLSAWFSLCISLIFLLLSFQCLNLDVDCLNERTVEFVDIAYDEVNPKHYKEEEVMVVN